MQIVGLRSIIVNASPNTNWIFVLVDTDAGIMGVGESTLDGFESPVAQALQDLAPLIQGKDPLQAVPVPVAAHGGRVYAAARSGIDQAIWDIRGKAYGVPVYQLLGGALRSSIPVYANINRGTRDRSSSGFADRAKEALQAGFQAVKCAPFESYMWFEPKDQERLLDVGIQRVRAVREAVGPHSQLMIDCHWRFDVPTAIRVARELAGVNLAWYEAPVFERDPGAVLEVKRQTGMRIAGGEMQISITDYRSLLEARCMDVLMPDVKYIGGLGALLKVASASEIFGLSIAPHNPSGPVATAATLHAAAAISNLLTVEYPFGQVDWYGELVQFDFRVQNGSMSLPGRPGLGVDLDLALAARYPYQPISPPQEPQLYVS